MGFRYRKSINLGGGFRINLSKSGVGYSWGTKGYRVTRTAKGTTRRTYSIPGTGLSYTDESGGRNNRQTGSRNSNRAPSQPTYQPVDSTSERAIESADISQFKQVEQGNVSTAVERAIRMNWIGTILLWGILLAFANPVFWLLPIAGVILKVVARTSGRVDLDYSFDAEKEEEHLRRMDAWQLLVEGDKEWQILTEQQNTNTRNHAGASRSLKRAECKIAKGHPFYIKTNVDTIQVVLHNKESLIILPDKVLFVRKRKVGAIDYTDFIINVSSTRFVESDPVPKDAQIVGQTWQYVNKNGTPDRRHKDNKQFPVCMYGQITLRSASGLNVELHISNWQNALDFAELIK